MAKALVLAKDLTKAVAKPNESLAKAIQFQVLSLIKGLVVVLALDKYLVPVLALAKNLVPVLALTKALVLLLALAKALVKT
jgi:hypothetical protein